MTESTPPEDQSGASPWAVFAHRDFSLLWMSAAAMTVTMIIRTLISTQWLYDTTGSAAQLGLLGAVQLLLLPMALFGGSLADRMDRKILMALTQLVNTVLLVILTVLAATNALEPWHIFVVTGITGMTNTLFNNSDFKNLFSNPFHINMCDKNTVTNNSSIVIC